MNKTFRAWDVDQAWLLPRSVHDFVPAGHPAHLIREVVREELELGAILAGYEEPRGYPPFHPGMMTALLRYAYRQGIYSSRRLARACEERVDKVEDAEHGPERRGDEPPERMCDRLERIRAAKAAADAKAALATEAAVVPLVGATLATTGAWPKEVSADAGFCSAASRLALAERRIRSYVATGRASDPAGGERQRRGPLVAAMRKKLRRAGRRGRCRLRKQVVEPLFGPIKQARGCRQFLLRGRSARRGRWSAPPMTPPSSAGPDRPGRLGAMPAFIPPCGRAGSSSSGHLSGAAPRR